MARAHHNTGKIVDVQIIEEAVRWENGRVTCRDQNGQRIKRLEGRYEKVRDDVIGEAPGYARFFVAKNCRSMQEVLRGSW